MMRMLQKLCSLRLLKKAIEMQIIEVALEGMTLKKRKMMKVVKARESDAKLNDNQPLCFKNG